MLGKRPILAIRRPGAHEVSKPRPLLTNLPADPLAVYLCTTIIPILMGYRNLKQCVADLAENGYLVKFETPVDACLEAAEIHRRVYRSGGPAILFTNVTRCRFPMVSNLFGTLERARFIFRDTLESVRRLIELKTDATRFWREPTRYWKAPLTAFGMLPRRRINAPVLSHRSSLDQLPHLKSWPDDGGAFITLPQVYSENVEQPGIMHSNLGMYRIQMSGGDYEPGQVGLHYQIHRGIGVHQAAALRRDQPFHVNVFVGGTPAMTLAAVMPLPEGLSELTFAGALAGHRIGMARRGRGQLPIYAEADFCISGTVVPDQLLPEGPFGDHLGYYSLAHNFPVLQVDQVHHRTDAIWPFTVVGRPPQEDTVFGQLIHDLVGPVIPTLIPGLHAVHAVDATGVHPLMLAIGSERYTPYQPSRQPAELLTQANAILGEGQMSLAKYLIIVNQQDDPQLDIHHVRDFFGHVLARVDWQRDLHFQTCTTIDTLDYSGTSLNEGSKLVIAVAGPVRRELASTVPKDLKLPTGFEIPSVAMPGVLVVTGPPNCEQTAERDPTVGQLCEQLARQPSMSRLPLVVIADDAEFTASSLENLLWVTFTRSNPAADVHGVGEFTHKKHWGCTGSLVIDARTKPHHAPPLVEDAAVAQKVDAIAARGGPLAKYL